MLVLVALALGLWRLGEIAAARAGRRWIEAGGRGAWLDPALRGIGAAAAVLAVVPLALGFAGLAVWSVAGPWPFPDLTPAAFSGAAWAGALPALGGPTRASLGIGLASAGVALLVALAWLEAETRRGLPAGRGALAILYLPLLAPQVAFLFGLQTLATAAGLDGGAAAVAAAHLVFVLPYVHLALADPWRALDPRYGAVAASLGAGPWRVFAAVRLPLLLAPVLTAAAVGFAVSIGLYLPTLLIGGGRVATLTTEAVALAAGGDRRLIGVYATLQTLAPALGFALALGLPALLWRDRRGLGGRR
jgi:putative thiamine transport system permease protein